MKYSQFLCFSFFAALSLSACATLGGEAAKQLSQGNEQGYEIAPRLSGRVLERGECGLFVWTADQDRRFIMFSQSQKSKAAWASRNGEIALSLVKTSGQSFQQQFTQQSFAEVSRKKEPPHPTILKLSLRNIEEVLESTRFQGGTLSQTRQDGTQRVIPIVGLSTCR